MDVYGGGTVMKCTNIHERLYLLVGQRKGVDKHRYLDRGVCNKKHGQDEGPGLGGTVVG